MVKRFAENKDVAFGDINLSKQQIRGTHSPGAGGWPTIKYFNKDTGVGGATYEKKTDKSMCDELGDDSYMQAYVEEAGHTSLCSVGNPDTCEAKGQEFIAKWKDSPLDQIHAQVTRLRNMKSSSKLTADAVGWIDLRLSILTQLEGQHAEL